MGKGGQTTIPLVAPTAAVPDIVAPSTSSETLVPNIARDANANAVSSTSRKVSVTKSSSGYIENDDDDDALTPAVPSKVSSSSVAGQTEFFWSDEDEPHAARRKAILAKYPEIKKLYGHDPIMKYQVLAVALLQISISVFMALYRPSWIVFFTVAYVVGGTCNHMLFMALHELAHNLGFKYQAYNKYFAIFVANLPLGIPAAVSFKRYHMDHHRYQGVDVIDVDIPSRLEGRIFNNTITKFFFVIFQLLFYAFRPTFINPKEPGTAEYINYVASISFDLLLWYCTGHFRSVGYLLLSTLLGGGLHPCAGHFIAEHYVFNTVPGKGAQGKGAQGKFAEAETYSYYGPLNAVTFNVGYHNEHHDFPFVPGRRLPQVRAIAAEFYNPLPHHTSWVGVLYKYITQSDVTGFSRVKRVTTSALNTNDDDIGADPIKVKKQN